MQTCDRASGTGCMSFWLSRRQLNEGQFQSAPDPGYTLRDSAGFSEDRHSRDTRQGSRQGGQIQRHLWDFVLTSLGWDQDGTPGRLKL